MTWWKNQKIRMIQNNLREIDAQMDAEEYAKTLEELGANVAMIGCGGISAFYPTKLPFQRTNPYLKGDFVGDIISACHARSIRVIARFDFSKVNVSFIDEHPDWFVRNIDGDYAIYRDTVSNCVMSPYYQKHMFEILTEVLESYPVDGIFFNGFLFGSFDYDGNINNICYCTNCQKAFFEYSGMELPKAVDQFDPIYQTYLRFKTEQLTKLMTRVNEHVKSFNPNIALSTYDNNVDLVRNESNFAVDRPLPFWIYSSSDNVASITDSFDDEYKLSCNVAINFVDFFARFMGVSAELTRLRLLGSMASGGQLDWCIIGAIAGTTDRKTLPAVKEVFHYHKQYEDYYAAMKPCARVMLVKDRYHSFSKFDAEYRGIFRILKESHIMFRVVEQNELDRFANRLDEFDIIFLPHIELDEDSVFTKALANTAACVIATGLSLQNNPTLLHNLFGVCLENPLSTSRGFYLSTEDKSIFTRFQDTDWIYLDKEYTPMKIDSANESFMPLILSAPFGPPEFCYGHEISQTHSVSIKNKRTIYLPFMLGTLYYHHGFEEFRHLLLDVIDTLQLDAKPFTTNAPSCVEIFWHSLGAGKYLMQLLNLSGFNGLTTRTALPIHDIEIDFRHNSFTNVSELCMDKEMPVELIDNKLRISTLDTFKAYLLNL